jgi:hypothetical protein
MASHVSKHDIRGSIQQTVTGRGPIIAKYQLLPKCMPRANAWGFLDQFLKKDICDKLGAGQHKNICLYLSIYKDIK